MEYNYYYNNIPGEGLCRNNLIYTSLISNDQRTFVQWYHNDTDYHRGQNQVIDPDKMAEKWSRELCYLNYMSEHAPDLIPKILDIDLVNKKIFLEIDGLDFWNRAECTTANYDSVIPDWREQMLHIIQTHKDLGLYKYSMHPSSYFLVDGNLKSINYFFTYSFSEPPITINSVLSHISLDRQADLLPKMTQAGININEPTDLKQLQLLTFESFKTNFPNDVMEMAKQIYV